MTAAELETQPQEKQLQAEYDDLHERLILLADNSELTDAQRELARAWRSRIRAFRQRTKAPLSLAFLAAVGRGKSSLIAAATGLRLATPGPPKTWSVLPVGDGRTTLGELRVCFADRADILLEVEPMAAEDLETEIRIFAEDSWAANAGKRGAPEPKGSAGEELFALLREWLVPAGVDDPWPVLDQEARAADNPESLGRDWLARIDLEQRSQPLRRAFAYDQPGFESLRDTLNALMRGTLAAAPVPLLTSLELPRTSALGQEFTTIIDTQGIDDEPDAWLHSRPDLHRLINDPDTLVVVCSNFNDAPDPISVSVLETIRDKKVGMGERALRLIIVDSRPTDADPAQQQAHARARKDRVRQCHDKLRRKTLDISDSKVIAVDVREQPNPLQAALVAMAGEARGARREAWAKALRAANDATSALRDAEFAAKARELDLRLWWAWDAELAQHERKSLDGLSALAQSLPQLRFHWSQLYATVRRRGRYPKLDLARRGAMLAATAGGHQHAVGRVDDAADILAAGADEAIRQPLFARANDFAAAVLAYRDESYKSWVRTLADYFKSHQSTAMWRWSTERWGQGSGYVQDVADRIGEEAKRAGLTIGDIPSVEARLPKRPELFSLRAVALQNFRGVEARTVKLAPTTTVLIGDNALGKTCWLEAIAAAVGTFLPGIGAGDAPTLRDEDVRTVIRSLAGVPDRQPQLPMTIEVEAIIEGYPLTWRRHVASLPAEQGESAADALRLKASRAAEEIRAHGVRQLPVLAYYGTQRLWPKLEASTERREVGNRLDGYRDCLVAASTHQHMQDWLRHYTFVELQRKQPLVQLRVIEQAVLACVEGAAAFAYEIALEQLMLTMKDGQCFTFSTLSDGYRNIVAMVADIAWRASVLNPHLGERAAELAEGVVLIDEIDLHLHPNWQRRVLLDLRRAFPRLQFIATTHSPFIIQSLQPGQLLNLDAELGADSPAYAGESPEDIAEQHMGVELPQRSERRRREYEVATRYYDLLALR